MLDADRIIRRRHELGLSQRYVARQLGVTQGTIGGIEAGTNHADLPLRMVTQLADVLALDLVDIIERRDQAGEAPSGGEELAQLGALLASTDDGATIETIAEAAGHTLEQATELTNQLDAHLRSGGLRLYRRGGRLRIVARDDARPSPQLQRLLRGQHVRHGLTAADAKLLHCALHGHLDPGALTNDEQVAHARLINANLVDTSGHLSDEVTFSLQPDRRPA